MGSFATILTLWNRWFHRPLGAAFFRSLSVCVLSVFSVSLLAASEMGLSWIDNSDNEVGFEVERMNPSESFEAIGSVDADVTSYTDTSVTPGLEYQYRVRAFNEFGYSGYTNVVVAALENTAPQIVSIDGAEPLANIELSFQRGEQLDPVYIEISDAESIIEELAFEITPFDPTVVPFESFSYTIEGNSVVLTLDSLLVQNGSTNISFVVSDGVESSEALISLTVVPNIAPRIPSLGTHDIYDGQTFGPFAFTIIDDDTAAENVVVTASSSNESMIPDSNIRIEGSGFERTVTVDVPSGVSGLVRADIHVFDGFSQKTAPLTLNVELDAAPTISGFESSYSIPAGGRINGIPFTIGDVDHGTSDLELVFTSSNTLLFPPAMSKIRGTGSSRTVDFVPTPRGHGSATIRISVSDGIKTTISEPIHVTVLPPAISVEVIEFRVENGYAVAEVAGRPGATFTLQRTYSLIGNIWENVEDVEILFSGDSVELRDPTIVEQAVCYRVFASQ